MITIDAIRRIADEVMSLHAHGCRALADGDVLNAQLRLSLANVKLRNLQRLLDEPPPKPPLRKLCIVGTPRENYSDIPEWMHKRHGGDDGDAA